MLPSWGGGQAQLGTNYYAGGRRGESGRGGVEPGWSRGAAPRAAGVLRRGRERSRAGVAGGRAPPRGAGGPGR